MKTKKAIYKICYTCGLKKKISSFYVSFYRKDGSPGYMLHCKLCIKQNTSGVILLKPKEDGNKEMISEVENKMESWINIKDVKPPINQEVIIKHIFEKKGKWNGKNLEYTSSSEFQTFWKKKS